MNTNRRGFLGFLAAAGITAIVGPEVAAKTIPAPAPTPDAGDICYSVTYKRVPSFFDLICYVGTGSSVTLPNNMGDAIGCVIIKCQTKPSDWFVLETDSAQITLPDGFNEAGHTYVAYQFGKEAMPKIQPYVDKLKEKNGGAT